MMEAPRRYGGHFKQYAFIWKQSFGQRQASYPSEDRRYVDSLPLDGRDPARPRGPWWLVLQEEVGRERRLMQFPTDQFIDNFVNIGCSGDKGRYLHRNSQFRTFLECAQIEPLLSPSLLTSNPRALIDDRNNDSVTRENFAGSCRPYKGPLNARQLLWELCQERLAQGPGLIPAERRLIYVADLDSFYALVLAITIQFSEARFLRDLIDNYLSFQALIRANIWSPSPSGQTSYSLEFHLPYYAWRQMPTMRQDTRLRADGTPLRHSEQSIPLRIEPDTPIANGDQEFIYEAQVSVIVTGINDWVWAAYCFVDIYFKEGEHTESVEHYSNLRTRLDPHSCGKYSADRPIWLPREYFLRAMQARMEQVKQEWSNSVSRLIQQTEPYVYSFTREDTDVGKMGGITQQKGFKWSIRVLRQFHRLLSKIVKSWDHFNSGEIRYFYRPYSDELAEPSWIKYLAAIDKDVEELRDLCSELQYQTDLFENMTNSLVTHAQHAETIITRLQSEFIQALTVITIFYLPPSLASTIFSMQGVLPTTASFMDWVYTLLGLFVATLVLLLNLPRITRLGAKLRTWQDQSMKVVRKFVFRNLLRRAEQNENSIELDELGEDESRDTEGV